MGIFGNDSGRPSVRALQKRAKLSTDPREAAALLTQASRLARDAGKARRALTLLREAVVRDGTYEEAARELDAVLEHGGHFGDLRDERERWLEVLLAKKSDARALSHAHARLAQTEERLGHLDSAFDHYERAFSFDPSQVGIAQAALRIAKDLGRWREAVDVIERQAAVTGDYPMRAALLRQQGILVRDHMADLDEAIRLFELAVRTHPPDVETRRELIDTLLLRADAGDESDRVSRDRYGAADLLVDLVNVVSPEEQSRCVLRALDVAPEHGPALELLEKLSAHDMPQLLDRWARHVAAFPDGPMADDVRWRLARQHIAEMRNDEGIHWLEELAARGDVEAMLRVVELHDVAGRSAQARKWAASVIEECGDSERLAHHEKLFELLAPGDQQGAEPHALALLADDPSHRDAFEVLSKVLWARGDREALVELHRDVIERVDERRGELLPHLARLLEDTGNITGALEAITEAEAMAAGPMRVRLRAERVRLAELAGEWDELAGLLEEEAESAAEGERIVILDKLVALHRGLRADPARASAALLELLPLLDGPRAAAARADLSQTLELSGPEASVVGEARDYARGSSPEDSAAVFRILARLHDGWRDHATAANDWLAVSSVHPEDTEALARSVDLAVVLERYEEAIDLLTRWVRLEPANVAVSLHRRISEIASEHLRDDARAADALTAALDLVPEDRELALDLASLLRRTERFGEEKIVLKLLLSSAPNAIARREHQERLARLSAGVLQDPEEALRVWTKLVNDTDQPGVLLRMRDEAREEADAARLDVILARLAVLTRDDAARSEHTYERAKLLAGALGRPQLAVRVLAHATSTHGTSHLQSFTLLESLAEDAGDRRLVIRALEGQIPLVDEQRKREALRKLAGLYDAQPAETTGLFHALSLWEEIAPEEADPRLKILPILAERGDWPGLLKRLDDLIDLSPGEAQQRIDLVAEAALRDGPEAAAPDKRRERDNARAWFLIEVAGRAKAPAQRLRLMESAADRFVAADCLDEAFTANARALELAGARESLLARAERVATRAGTDGKLDALYDNLIAKAPTDVDRAALAIRYANHLEARERGNDAVDLLLRVSVEDPTNETLLTEIERIAPASDRMDDLLSSYIGRGELLGGARAVHLIRRGMVIAKRANRTETVEAMLEAALREAGLDDALLDEVEATAEKLGKDVTKDLVRIYEALGTSPRTPKDVAARMLLRAAAGMGDKLGLADVAFGILKQALALSPTDEAVLDTIEASAAERSLTDHLLDHLAGMARETQNRAVAARLHARRGKILEERLGKSDDAAEEYLKALSYAPADDGILRRLRFCLIETGRVQELIGVLVRRLEKTTDEAPRTALLRDLAHLWENEAQNRWEALDIWKRLLELTPDDAEAKESIARLERESRRPV